MLSWKEANTLDGEPSNEASAGDQGRDAVDTTPPNIIFLQLGKGEVLQQSSVMARSSIKLSFGNLASGNGRAGAEIVAGGSVGEMVGC